MFATTREEAERAYKIAIAHTSCKAEFDRIFVAELEEVSAMYHRNKTAMGYFELVEIAIERTKARV